MSTEVVGKDPSARVRIVELDEPVPITEPRLLEWSQGFSIPTVVRNAFSRPKIEASLFFGPDRILNADIGKVGEFRDFNGQYPWSQIWSSMTSGEDVYGSFGTGTANLDEATVGVIQRLKRRILPADVFADDENPGHIIFGSARERQATTGWHNAIDANLLFQLHGTKHLYSMERLPSELHPVSISAFTYLVERDRELAGAGDGREDQEHLFGISACVTLQSGDMLINTPYSWHAVRIDEFNLSLSLRGDRSDVMAWLAFRYFDGHIDHPLLASFGILFDEVTYGASMRDHGGFDLRSVGRIARRQASIARSRVRNWLGLDSSFNPILDQYSASTSASLELRAAYKARFDKYQGSTP